MRGNIRSRLSKERLLRVKILERGLGLARQQLTISQAKERIVKTQWEIKQISDLQYKAARLAREEATANVTLLNIDFLLARISFELQK